MNIYEQKLAASMGIGRIMGSKWSPVLAPPGEGGNGEAQEENNENEDDEAARAEAAAAKAEEDAAAARKAAEEAKRGKPSDKEAALLKEQMKTKGKLTKAEADLAAAKAELEKYKGIDPEKAKAAAAEAKKAEEDRLAAAGDFDRLKEMMKTEHEAALKTATDNAKEKETALEAAQAQIADLTVGAAFSNSTFVSENLILTPKKARTQFGAHFELHEGEVVGYNLPAGKKNRTMLVDGSGTPLSFEKALRKIVEADDEKDTILKSKLLNGGNSGTQNNGGGKQRTDDKGVRGAGRMAEILRERAKNA